MFGFYLSIEVLIFGMKNNPPIHLSNVGQYIFRNTCTNFPLHPWSNLHLTTTFTLSGSSKSVAITSKPPSSQDSHLFSPTKSLEPHLLALLIHTWFSFAFCPLALLVGQTEKTNCRRRRTNRCGIQCSTVIPAVSFTYKRM